MAERPPSLRGEVQQITQAELPRQPRIHSKIDNGWLGIASADQDRAAIQGQGPVADRPTEHLAPSDRGVAMFRAILCEAITAVERGRDPINVIRDPKENRLLQFGTHQHDVVPLHFAIAASRSAIAEGTAATELRGELSSMPHRLQQHGDFDRREIGKSIGDRVGQNDLVVVSHGSACVDDVRHISFALGQLGLNQRFARSCEHLRGIHLVEECRADRIFPHRADAVRQQQPAFVELDRRSAIADLDQLP